MPPSRNQPCPCGSGTKYKKCCGRDVARPTSRPVALRPAYRPGDEVDPAYWRALKAARNPRIPVRLAHEDPRTTAAMLGLPFASDRLREPPRDEDFDALIQALEAPADPCHVRLEPGAFGDELVLDVPRALNRDVKALPGRWFDWGERVWRVPCSAAAASGLSVLLEAFDWLRASDAVVRWLSLACRWRALGTVLELEGKPWLAVATLAGEAPSALREAAEADGRWHLLGLEASTVALLEGLGGLELDDVARAGVADLRAGRAPAPAVLVLGTGPEDEARLELHTGWGTSMRQAFAALPEAEATEPRAGRFALAGQAIPLAVPADAALEPALDTYLREHPLVRVEPAARERLDAVRAEHARLEATVALSRAEDAELSGVALGGELRPFQRAGVRYALEQRRTFLADEQGLGKTVQALAALEADGAYPAVVVCPASMKLTWERETRTWLPERRVAVLHGRGAAGWSTPDVLTADVTIVNYEIVAAHRERLAGRGLRAAIFDESHYCKEARAQRTKASIDLAGAVAPDGLRLALTGTPVLNRPPELISQLRLVGRLGDFGSGASLSRRFRGPDCHERLHWQLRGRCYVRRTKADVLPQLPAKRRSTVPIRLDNEREYRRAEEDVIAWLRDQPLDLRVLAAKVAAALRAEQLVRLNHLRQLAARGKLASALAWIGDFLASGEPLLVFAEHVEIQRAVVDRFPGAAHVLGADSLPARRAAVDAFQRPDGPPLIVCSMKAAGQGLTLTRASHVAFLELGWTPALHDQAEDRCHRIGQEDAVTAYYLLAPETIDETMSTLLQRKRGVVEAVTDGRRHDTDGLVAAIVRDLRGRPYRHLRAVA